MAQPVQKKTKCERTFLFTPESLIEGNPWQEFDEGSDAALRHSKVACDTATKGTMVKVAGLGGKDMMDAEGMQYGKGMMDGNGFISRNFLAAIDRRYSRRVLSSFWRAWGIEAGLPRPQLVDSSS